MLAHVDYSQLLHLYGCFRVLWYSVRATNKAKSIPLIVQQINFGQEIDFERWCITDSMRFNVAAIRIFGLVVDTAFFAKTIWISGLAVTYIITQIDRSDNPSCG